MWELLLRLWLDQGFGSKGVHKEQCFYWSNPMEQWRLGDSFCRGTEEKLERSGSQ